MKLVTAPNPSLRVTTTAVKKITPELTNLAKEMIKMTKTFTDPEGVGLASTQIGRTEKFFVAQLKDKDPNFEVCFNPEILSASKKTKLFFEGCLSIPNIYGETIRPIIVTVRYTNIKGEVIKKRLNGLGAWVFQHEVDHLNGSLFMDTVLTQKGKVYKSVGRDKAGSEIFEQIKID